MRLKRKQKTKKLFLIKNNFIIILILLLTSCRQNRQEVLPIKPAKIIIEEKEGAFSAGFGMADITPDLGPLPLKTSGKIPKLYRYPLAGYGRKRYARSVHDALWARAVVFELGGKRVGIVYLDLIGLHHNHIDDMRKVIPKELGLDYVIIGATHNHEGPDTLGFWGRGLKSGIRNDYMLLLQKKVAESLQLAVANIKPAVVNIAQGSVKDLGLTVDLRKPEVIPDILTIIQIKNQDKILGNIIHWENHPEALGKKNTAITSDFPHYIRVALEEKFKAPTIYWGGALGGLMAPTPVIKNIGKTFRQGNFNHAEVIGNLIGTRAIELLKNSQEIKVDHLTVCAEVAQIRISNFVYKLGSMLGILKRKMPKLKYVETEVAVVCIGELHLQTIPGEIYPELVYGPLDSPLNADFPNADKEEPVILKMMGGKYNLVLGLALDEVGYIIPKNGWDNKKPYLENHKKNSYGEELSPDSQFAKNLHEIIKRLNNMVQLSSRK